MKNKYLGFICLLYSSIVGYVYFKGYLNNFLAPNLQTDILIATPVFIIMGIVLLVSHSHSKFKISDLILLLPLIMLLFAGDGKLSTSLASNRSSNFTRNTTEKKAKKVEKSVIKEEKDTEEVVLNTDEFDFDVTDESYVYLSNGITYSLNPEKLEGKTIRVRGFVLKKAEFIPKGYFGIGKYMISCCAADASFGGFMAKYSDMGEIKNDGWYEMTGVLEATTDDYNNPIAIINVTSVKEIDKKKEELYIYPCYSYSDAVCEQLKQYDLE